jgi:hypothetical protein
MKIPKLIMILVGVLIVCVLFLLWFIPHKRKLDVLDKGYAKVELFSVSRNFIFETYLQCRVVSRGVEIERQTLRRSYDSFFEIDRESIKISGFNVNDQSFTVQISPNETQTIHMNCLSGKIEGHNFFIDKTNPNQSSEPTLKTPGDPVDV